MDKDCNSAVVHRVRCNVGSFLDSILFDARVCMPDVCLCLVVDDGSNARHIIHVYSWYNIRHLYQFSIAHCGARESIVYDLYWRVRLGGPSLYLFCFHHECTNSFRFFLLLSVRSPLGAPSVDQCKCKCVCVSQHLPSETCIQKHYVHINN